MTADADKTDDVPFVNPSSPILPRSRGIFEQASQGMPFPLRDQLEKQAATAEDHVALSARATSMATVGGQFNVVGNDAALTVTHAATTVIGKAVLSNKATLQLAAFSLRASLDAKLEQIHVDRSNSEDPAQYEDLRRRVDEFLIASMSDDEAPVVATTLSLADGLRNWWTVDYSSICNKALNMGLFAGGLAICGLAGALGPVSVPIVGALVGGKDVVSALESCVKLLVKRD